MSLSPSLLLLRLSFVLVAAAALLRVVPAHAECGCSANPGTLTSDSTGPCLRYAAPSGPANDITYRFAEAYACGTYATGEFFVVAPAGGARITAISPAASGGRHGVDVNPSPDGPQRWDRRLDDHQPSLALPYSAAAGSSVVKYVSDNPTGGCDGSSDEKSCGRFAAVVTVVGAAPADPARAFRPPFVGTHKPSFSTADLRTALLSRLERGSCSPPSLSSVRAWTAHLRLDYTSHSVTCDLMPPEDALPGGRPWSTDIWANDTDAYAWLHLANVCATPPCTAAQDQEAKRPVLIGYVQHGIDVWAVDRMGASLFRGGGGNGGGKLLAAAFATAVLPAPELRTGLAGIDPDHFFETASYYAGKNGVALWGQPTGSEREYWDDFADKSTRTIREPYGLIDGGFEPGGWYQDNTAKPTQYSALLLRLMPALKSVWPVNADVILAYADRWVEHGALAKPDSCAPVGGRYGVDYGPNGAGACIAGPGRVPALDGNNRDGGNRERAFGECLWRTFRQCAEDCSCAGQSCGGASGTGGASGSGGTSAGGAPSNGGAASNGGATPSGGANVGANGGTTSAGGTASSSGATSNGGAASNGGATPSGGANAGTNGGNASGGADAGSPPPGGDGGGCDCHVANRRSSMSPAWIALFVLAHRALRRRPRDG